MTSTDITVEDLQVHFPIRSGVLRRVTATARAVDGVSFTVPAGSIVSLVGESGSGKSTTGRALIGLAPISGGSVRLHGEDLAARPRLLATVLLTLAEIAGTAGEHAQSGQLAGEAARLRAGVFGRYSPEHAEALVVHARALWSERGLEADPEAMVAQAVAVLEREAPESEGHVRALLLQQILDINLDRAALAQATGERLLAWCHDRAQQPFALCSEIMVTAAMLQGRQGYVRQAERTYAELIALHAAREGSEHVRTLEVRTRHARAVLLLGDAARAAALLEPVLGAQRGIYDRTTPELAATRGALAEAYTTLGDFTRARELHEAQLAELVANMDAGTRPLTSGPEARRTMELLSAIYKSAFTGEAVRAGSIRPGDPHYAAVQGANPRPRDGRRPA